MSVVAIAAIAAIAVAGVVVAQHDGGQDAASVATETDKSTPPTADGETISCGPLVSEPSHGPQAIVMGSENQAALAAHFGDRLNARWTGKSLPELGDDQRVMVSATGITDADRAFVRTIPVHGGHIELVESVYSARELKEFAARLQTRIPDWSLPPKYVPPTPDNRVESILDPPSTTTIPIPESVWPTGLFNAAAPYPRDDGSDRSRESIVSIAVVDCSPELVDEAVRIAHAEQVPLDAIRMHATHWDETWSHD